MCKFLVVKGCTGGFCEKLLDVSLCLTEPRPAGSKTDLLLVMTGPMSNSARASGITQLGKGGTSCTTAAREGSEGVSEATVQTPRLVQKQEEELLQVPEQIPLLPMVRYPCSPWRSVREPRSICSPWRTAQQTRWVPEGGCDPVENPCYCCIFTLLSS